MTTDKTPDFDAADTLSVASKPDQRDVIEQAAASMHSDQCPEDPDEGDYCSCDWDHYRRLASALADAHLLADSADREELTYHDGYHDGVSVAEAVAKITPCTCSAQRSRAERAEAEVSELRATVARVRRETAMDWAGYFRTADSAVGWPTLTIASVIELLESGHEPFGCSAALDGGEQP